MKSLKNRERSSFLQISIISLISIYSILLTDSLWGASRHGYLWIVNTNEGTISKISESTGNEIARYYTAEIKPAYPASEAVDHEYWWAVGRGHGVDPSRTAFDKDGNCWVLNIAFPRPFDPIPANRAGVPSITKFLTNPPTPTSHSSTPLPWGADAAAAKHFSIPNSTNTGGRGLAVDKSGFVWVGLYNLGNNGCPDWNGVDTAGQGRILKLDPENGTVLSSFEWHSVYGMATAPSGMLYYISRACGTVSEINPGNESCGGGGNPRVTRFRVLGDGYHPYAITVDKNGIVWMNAFRRSTRDWYVRLYRYDPSAPDNTPLQWFDAPDTKLNIATDPNGDKYFNQGSITVDAEGWVWFVNSKSGNITRYVPGIGIASHDLPIDPDDHFQPVGCALASDGNIYVTMKNGTGTLPGYWAKINRTTFAVMNTHYLGRTEVGVIGNNIYARGDMTGWDPERINRPPTCYARNVTVPAGSNCVAFADINSVSTDPDCDDITISQSPPGPYPLGQTTVTLIVTDQFGVTSQCTGIVTVIDATPPIVECPQNIVLSAAAGQCGRNVIFSYGASDVCSSVQTSVSHASGSFFPVGTTTVIVSAVDAYGNSSSCSFNVTITNTAPNLVVPPNDSIFQCTAQQVCLPFSSSDAENNLSLVSIVNGPGTLVGSNWCYTPSGDEVVNITIRAIDVCGAYTDRSFRMVFDINEAPALSVPPNDSVFQCNPTQICRDVISSDSDGNLQSVVITSGPGMVSNGSWCYTPAGDEVALVTISATDNCGYTTEKSFRIVFDVNTSPVLVVPPSQYFFQCRASEVCLPYSATDIDNNIVTAEITSGPGVLSGGNWCFTPSLDQTVQVTITITDACGEVAIDTFSQRFDLNQPPLISCPPNATIHWGDLLNVTAFASDSDLATYSGEYLRYSLGSQSPTAANINPVSGQINWQTTGSDVCDHTFEVVISDTCSDADTCYFDVCVQNTRPSITCTTDTLLFVYGSTVYGSVSAIDPDSGPNALQFSVVDFTGPGIINLDAQTGEFNWPTMLAPEYTGIFALTISVSDGANTCSPCSPENADTCVTYIKVVSSRICIEKVHNQIQGQYAFVNIYGLPDEFFNYPFGGFDLLVSYDQSALSFVSVSPGEFITDCRWEYFTYRVGVNGNCGASCPSGFIRIVAVAETNNGANHPLCFSIESPTSNLLATIKFLVSNDRSLECQFVPVRFVWYDCGDNTFSAVSGDTLMISRDVYDYRGVGGVDTWELITDPSAVLPTQLGAPALCWNPDLSSKYEPWIAVDFCNGGVDIVCADSIDARGDLNLNGISYEIADAVLYTNYFLFGVSALSSDLQYREGQIAASDTNADGLPLSVGDLVYLLRVVVGDALPYAKLAKYSNSASVSFDGVFSINSSVDVGAIFVRFKSNGTYTISNLSSMQIESAEKDGVVRVLVYSGLDNMTNHISSGSSPIFTVNGDLELTDVEISDYNGNLLNVVVSKSALPEEFSLSQNRPNPFNPSTEIEFGLPKSMRVTLVIYNILGAEVATLLDEVCAAGVHRISWHGTDNSGKSVTSGVYLYRLVTGDFETTRKMLLLK